MMQKKSNVDLIISKNLKNIMSNLCKELEQLTGKDDIALSLIIFNHENKSRLNYISNIDRTTVQTVWETVFDSWKKGMPDIPAHKYES